MRRSLSLLACIALVAAAPSGAAGLEGNPVPELDVPAGAEPFVGSEVCEVAHFGRETIEGVRYIVEHFTCSTETSDPRASGTEELDVYTRTDGASSVLPWVAFGEFSTEGGSWRGSAEGMVDVRGASPLGTRGLPFNYGEMTYVGEGVYEGLVMHYYLAGGNDVLGVAGWIGPAGD